ncbi:topoisomerase II-associated protein PAT1 [Naematelia encephala]|uniref:Topoisomerase II-associated protein PAT1 n=1 Tax=Naematelia encephala TaxID=71784 RepID=A0A1Y2AWH2_9TREE|nr:topoisomerase II-associated protein PAT1 [Naematelia encephala]
MSGFFGFDAALPERRAADQSDRGFHQSQTDQMFTLPNAREEEDLAVYNWGDMGASLMEDGDDFNDETFGGSGPVDQDFQFAPQAAPVASQAPRASANQPRGPIASTASRYGPKKAFDPFAASEDDFYAARPTAKKPSKPAAKPKAQPAPSQGGSLESLWSKPAAPSPLWGATPSTTSQPPLEPRNSQTGPPPPGQIKSLEEIEAEMAGASVSEPPRGPTVVSLEEIERQMMSGSETQPIPLPAPPPREQTPVAPGLAGSGYATQQALLDSMFPELGAHPPSGQHTASFPPGVQGPPSEPSPQQREQMEALHRHISAKIESMSRYNNLMGTSDKDFITRIQLSQLATTDPYASDFYAQVFSALKRSRMPASAEGGDQSVVKISQNFGLGVSGPTGSRFGKMGSATMQKLSGQVKRLVENRALHQKHSNTAALQGALGRVSRGNTAAPRPVLAMPTTTRAEVRPVNQLNQQAGPRRQPLTRKQVMYALEELYDAMLELEQTRRDMPPPTAMEEVQRWNEACAVKVQVIWQRAMVMEPLDVSNPHPFISLMNAVKGQRLFPRLLRHLPEQQALTLLTLLVATYSQLDVVARAPPPPVADASLLTKADRVDRARREVETDNFLHCVVPGVDMLINQCKLGLVAGLLGILLQRSNVAQVASTRPGVALLTALLSRAQSLIRVPAPDPMNPQQVQVPDANELDQWNKTYAYLLQTLLPHLSDLFPSSIAQKAAFGPGAYLMSGAGDVRDGVEMERREAEVWGFAAALAVNAPEEEQTNLVGALRDKILHTVQAARDPSSTPERAQIKLRNVNMFLNGLGLDASMIE